MRGRRLDRAGVEPATFSPEEARCSVLARHDARRNSLVVQRCSDLLSYRPNRLSEIYNRRRPLSERGDRS